VAALADESWAATLLFQEDLMADKDTQLPWEDLRRMEGGLPWPALESFANAVVTNPDLARELFAEYERAWRTVDVPTYVDLYVPAIFVLAAPKLGEQQCREIGSFLVDKLIEAGHEEADLNEEALLSASGSMGPAILPKVLDTLEAMPKDDDSGAWSRCWNLTALAAKTEDAVIRDRTIHACIGLLEQIEHGEYEEFLGISAAWTLALLKCNDAAPLIQRLGETCDDFSGGADYREALEFLQERAGRTAYKESWESPVREWLESSWQMAKDWYAQGDPEGSEEEEKEETASWKRANEMTDKFVAAAMNPGNRGPAKKFTMQAMRAGVDTTDQEALQKYMLAQVQGTLTRRAYDSPDPMPITPPIPIVEHSPKIGRNDPCPCGSGKKYKKCCGDSAKGQTATPLRKQEEDQ
jgi:hypothetical protein